MNKVIAMLRSAQDEALARHAALSMNTPERRAMRPSGELAMLLSHYEQLARDLAEAIDVLKAHAKVKGPGR